MTTIGEMVSFWRYKPKIGEKHTRYIQDASL